MKALAAGRTIGITSPPDMNLLCAIDPSCFGFVHALQLAVVAFVQHWRAVGGNGCLSQDGQDNLKRVGGALENRRSSEIESDVMLTQQLSGSAGFSSTRIGQGNIGPAGEPILKIPQRFSMPHQDQYGHGERSSVSYAKLRYLPW